MWHIFINDFTEEFMIYKDLLFIKKESFSDYSFLYKYNDYDICYITEDSDILPADKDKCLVGWEQKLVSLYGDKDSYLWFMNLNMSFCSTKGHAARESYRDNHGTHIFVGDLSSSKEICIPWDAFCTQIIKLYHGDANTNQCTETDLMSHILEIKESINNLLGNKDVVKEHIVNDSSFEANINKKLDYIISTIEMQSGDRSDDSVDILKEELDTYRSDFYLKSVKRMGLDAIINILEHFCNLYHDSNDDTNDKEIYKTAITYIENVLKRSMRVSCFYTQQGESFDPDTMIAYEGDYVSTNDDELRGKVAESIVPAIYWTLPRINSEDQEYLYKEEVVVLYK